MKIEFILEDQVHHFKVSNTLSNHDLSVIRAALLRYFENQPHYVLLNLSETEPTLDFAPSQLDQIIAELNSMALSKKILFKSLAVNEDATHAISTLLESALNEKTAIFEEKLKVKKEIQDAATRLLDENKQLKEELRVIHEPSPATIAPHPMSTLLDQFWSP